MKLDHIGIAVPDLETGRSFWGEALGLTVGEVREVPSEGVRVEFYEAGGGVHVELLEGLGPESPVATFLAKRGPGIHHLCFQVDDLDAALEKAEGAGYRRAKDPGIGAHGGRVVFLHPKGTGGVLLELSEPAPGA